MGFNYGDVEISLNPRSLRYYNDLIWYLYSIIGYLPIVSIIIYKIFNYKAQYNRLLKNTSEIKRSLDDLIIIIFVIWGPFYYLFDFLITLLEGTMFVECRFPLFYHHIVSIVVLSKLLFKKVYFWWELLVAALHAMVVYDCGQIVTYTYVVSVFYFNYKCCVYPYNKLYQIKFIGKFFPFMYYTFIMVLFYGCSSPMPYID